MTATEFETAAKMVARLADDHVGADAISTAMLHEVRNCPERMRALLAEVLPAYVRPRLHDARVRAARALSDLTPAEEEELGVRVLPDEPTLDEPTPAEPPQGGFVSRRVERAFGVYERLLATQYATEHGARRLADCTPEDLDWAAQVREDQAAGMVTEAKRLRRLAAIARDYGAAHVSELPPVEVIEIMRRSAA